jgi:hypothetical protein
MIPRSGVTGTIPARLSDGKLVVYYRQSSVPVPFGTLIEWDATGTYPISGSDQAATNFLWLVEQFLAETPSGNVAGFQGVFDTKEAAVAACRDANYCVTRIELNAQIPHGAVPRPMNWYPHTEPEPDS